MVVIGSCGMPGDQLPRIFLFAAQRNRHIHPFSHIPEGYK
jgi:hypothetical protein